MLNSRSRRCTTGTHDRLHAWTNAIISCTFGVLGTQHYACVKTQLPALPNIGHFAQDVIKVANLQVCGGGGLIPTPNKTCQLYHTRTEIFCAPEDQHMRSLASRASVCSVIKVSFFKALSPSFHPSPLSHPQLCCFSICHAATAVRRQRALCWCLQAEVEAKLSWQAGAAASQNPARWGENEGRAGVFPFHASPVGSSWSITAADLSLRQLLFLNIFMF